MLRRGADLEAGRCVNDLWSSDSKGLDAKVVSSLVFLAGAPDRERLGHFGDASSPRDMGGLRTVATHAPEIVTSVLRSMLPPPAVRTSLHLPPGAFGRVGATSDDTEYERASAAVTIRALAQSHPLIAGELIAPMVLNLAVPAVDRYDQYAIASVERALATLCLLGIGDVLTQLNTAGQGAAEGHRERLFNVLQAAGATQIWYIGNVPKCKPQSPQHE